MTARTARVVGAVIVALTLMMAACGSESEGTATAADFYRGNTINLIVSARAGGMTDLVARVIAPYLERDTGAHVVVTNRTSAGGLDGMNRLYRSEPDGLTLGTVNSGKFVTNKGMDEPAAAYEIDEFSYIMNIGHRLYHFMVSPDGPYQSVAELQAGEDLKIGGSSPSGTITLGGLTVIELLELDAQVVTGLEGEAVRELAVKRGEIAGYFITPPSAKVGIESGMVKPILVLATERDPSMPEVPTIIEQGSITEEEIELVELFETVLAGSNMLAAPPDIPQDRLTYLRGLADKWTQDEEFRSEINRVSGHEELSYEIGDTVKEVMLNLTDSLDDFRAIFSEMIEKYGA